MRIKVWGCRGSLATPGPDTVHYGGNTSSVQVTLDDEKIIVLDAGTGIRPLGLSDQVREAREVHLLLTHLHLDHLEGLGFFGSLFRPDVELHVWGPPSPLKSLRQRVTRYLSPPLFPVHLDEIPNVTLHDAPDGELAIGSAVVYSQPVAHNGPAVGYRIEEGGRSLAYIPDHEPAHGVRLTESDPSWISGYGIAEDADLLLHDSQYTEDEYPQKMGWGHSSIAHVVDFARVTRAKQLILFHHDPTHDDDSLRAHERRGRILWGSDGDPPILAHEGMEVELKARAGARFGAERPS
jgi:phosphoribosyl 1,2-cyclic phosphodiesterase